MDVALGQTAHRQMVVTADMVAKYAEITGDYNPLHFDEEFAGQTRFKRLICQGGITTGLLHALVAMEMPGAGTVFINQSWSFPRPVYIGDRISAEARVTSVHPTRPLSHRKPLLNLPVGLDSDDLLEVVEGGHAFIAGRGTRSAKMLGHLLDCLDGGE